MFTSSSHFQINGGNFVKTDGDFNVQNIRPRESVGEVLTGLKFRADPDSGRQLVGIERSERSARKVPYDLSHRRLVELKFHPASKPDERSGEGADTMRLTAKTHRSHLDSGMGPLLSDLRPSDRLLPKRPLSLNGNRYTQSKSHSADVHVDLTQFSGDVNVETQPATNKSAFPWNRPQNASATSINGGTFIGGNVNNIHHGEAALIVQGWHILHRAIAGDAFHDSAERYPPPRCHPETRMKLLDVLWNWACGIEPPRNWTSDDEDLDGGHSAWASKGGKLTPSSEGDNENYEHSFLSTEDIQSRSGILWLNGPAGSGKSAVAQSFCQRLKDEGCLGGSFFFKRGHFSRGNAKKLFPTIAYQLALLLPELKHLISQAVENDPAIVDRALSYQLQELIIEPCRRSHPSEPVPIIIDGLDECDGHDIQQEVLRSFSSAVHQEDSPILFLITSRPESHIRETFSDPCLDKIHRSLNINQSFQDVRTYLLHEFGRIHREHRTMTAVPSPWPRTDIVEDLVEKSSGYFIYVSTVIRFIDDKRFRPVDRLNIILGINNNSSGSPFNSLDQLYHQILSGVPTDFQPQLLKILTFIAAPLCLSVFTLERLLELEQGDVQLILRDLHSLIKIPLPDEDKYEGLRLHHASFQDFLENCTRSGPFSISGSESRTNVTYHILRAFSYGLDDPW
ncbi:NACHT domain-containing protein [Mycena venus]|uniref:NACHT domain-containing protein n=1 Tax=Mycena venus TaxID=2733690 RepID=A0A8H6Z1G8_9AGAR|nr:NACHT domain-containing protein [Mycena venus]